MLTTYGAITPFNVWHLRYYEWVAFARLVDDAREKARAAK